MDVDRARVAVPVVAPNAVEDLLPRERQSRALCEEPQQIEFLGGELDGFIVDADLAPAAVDRDPTGLHDLRGGGAVGATQHGLHARDELSGGERLRDVVVGTELEAQHPVDLAVARGQEDDRDLRRLADLLAHLEPVDIGETHVEDHQPGTVLAEGVDAAFAGRALEHTKAFALEVHADEVRDRGFVLDDDDRPFVHLSMVARQGNRFVRAIPPSQDALGFTVRACVVWSTAMRPNFGS